MKLKTNLLRILFMLSLCSLLSAAAFAENLDLRVFSTEMSDSVELREEPEDDSEELSAPQVAAANVPTFTTSDAVFDIIEVYEGFMEYRYYYAGVAYIGYGSVFTDAVNLFGENCEPLSKAQAKQLSRHELDLIDQSLNSFLKKNGIVVNQNQYDALSDFTYTCGIGWTTYKNSDGTWCLLKQMLLDDPSTWTESRVSTAFGTWVKDSYGNVLDGLKRRRVTETQLFMKAANQSGFTDVATGAWYYDYVVEAKELGIMVGNGNGTFSPETTLTRAELVRLLASYAGADLTTGTVSGFSDVKADAWYAKVVAWAKENGYVSGYPDGSFHPNDAVSREDFCSILARYLRKQGASYPTKTVTFPDADKISDYAKADVLYCASIGLVSGTDGGKFDPGAGTKRAEAASIMVRLVKLG